MASIYSEENYRCDEILLRTIYQYAGYSKRDLTTLLKAVRQGDLAIETVLENALACAGNLERCSTKGMDFTDGSDAKKAKVANQGTATHVHMAADISTKNKNGILRCMVVDPATESVHYFKVTPSFYKANKSRQNKFRINFNNNGGKPSCKPGSVSEEVWSYEVKTFEELAS
jgi:hypothetical protein